MAVDIPSWHRDTIFLLEKFWKQAARTKLHLGGGWWGAYVQYILWKQADVPYVLG